jgi:hypothetical protein
MIREYIDIDTTARMWMLRESLGKPRGNVYLTNEGVRAVFKEVARRSVVNEGPWLDKLKGYDFGVENSFDRGGYQKNNILKPHSGQGSKQIRPRNGKQGAHIAPLSGAVMTLN